MACLRGKLCKRWCSLHRLFFWPNHLAGWGNIQDLEPVSPAAQRLRRPGARSSSGRAEPAGEGCQAQKRVPAIQTSPTKHQPGTLNPETPRKVTALGSVLIKNPHSLTHSAESFVRPPQQTQKTKGNNHRANTHLLLLRWKKMKCLVH